MADVKAFDMDEGVYGELNYSIQASYLYRSGSNVTSGIVTSPFSISADGRVTTNSLVSTYNQYRFESTVVAFEKENPSHNASVALNVRFANGLGGGRKGDDSCAVLIWSVFLRRFGFIKKSNSFGRSSRSRRIR